MAEFASSLFGSDNTLDGTTPLPTGTSPFDLATLCTDFDLTTIESKMPAAAQRVKQASGYSAYDGKRDLAKWHLSKELRRRNVRPESLLTPAQLKYAAAYLELSLIFNDLADTNDSLSMQKAKTYERLSIEELDSLELDIDPTYVPTAAIEAHVISSIPCRRM